MCTNLMTYYIYIPNILFFDSISLLLSNMANVITDFNKIFIYPILILQPLIYQ